MKVDESEGGRGQSTIHHFADILLLKLGARMGRVGFASSFIDDWLNFDSHTLVRPPRTYDMYIRPTQKEGK